MEDLEKYMTVRMIAERSDITEEAVLDLIKAQEIKAARIDN